MNLRTQLQRIIKRAGLEPWLKLWQNMRSTRETELADQFPAHVASAWIGNSVAVAPKHYLQVTEDHFAQAAQNAAQKAHESAGNGRKLKYFGAAQVVTDAGDSERFPVVSEYFTEREVGGAGPRTGDGALRAQRA